MNNKGHKTKNYQLPRISSIGTQIAPPAGYRPYYFILNGGIHHRTEAFHLIMARSLNTYHYIFDLTKAENQRMQMRENNG